MAHEPTEFGRKHTRPVVRHDWLHKHRQRPVMELFLRCRKSCMRQGSAGAARKHESPLNPCAAFGWGRSLRFASSGRAEVVRFGSARNRARRTAGLVCGRHTRVGVSLQEFAQQERPSSEIDFVAYKYPGVPTGSKERNNDSCRNA